MATEATTHHALGEATLAELEQSLRGQLIRPGDPDYDDARSIWNGAYDARPAVVVRCAGVGDVMLAVDFARSENLDVAVRGGGHSIPGFSTSDGGIVIDLSPMNSVRVDPAAAPRSPKAARPGRTSTTRPRRSGWPPPAG